MKTAAAMPLLCGLLVVLGADRLRSETWDGPKLKPAPRQEVYEFAKPPTFKRLDKDRYEIAFASKGACDVAVAIHDGSGKLVRHIVYGVLGANAPEPFGKDSLEQTLAWDGKDDAGQYVNAPQDCTARVSLGLKPTFDKVLGYHPKDAAAGGQIIGLAIDRDGAYVLQASCHHQLRMFDHDGNYLRTLWPFPADKFEANKPFIPTRTVEEDGRYVPQLHGHGNIFPMGATAVDNCMVAAAGKIAMFTRGGFGDLRRLLRLRPDATTGGEMIEGPFLQPFGAYRTRYGAPTYGGPIYLAVTPDAKWLYVGGLSFQDFADIRMESRPYRINTVYRFAWNRTTPVIDDDSFVGEPSNDPRKAGADSDDQHLNRPRGLAVDAQNRLYISDTGNRRIQVFGPDGKKIQTIPNIEDAERIAIHQKTGEIYLLRYQRGPFNTIAGCTLIVTKLSALPEAKALFEQTFATSREDWRLHGFAATLAVDSWTPRPRLWLVQGRGMVRIYEERGDRFELIDDFEKDVEAAGLRPHMLGGGHHNRVEADATRNHLYYLRGPGNGALLRCDPEGVGRWTEVVTPSGGGGEEMDFGTNGLLYLRWLNFCARFDPSKAVVSADKITLPMSAEVPFDYGEVEGRRGYKGVIPINAMPGANGFDTGFGVGPNGDMVSFMKNYQDAAGGAGGQLLHVIEGKLDEDRYRPRLFPGRSSSGELVMRWSSRGELLGEDLVPALPMASCGIKTDRDGNLYLGVGANMFMADGKPHSAGALAKFPPGGGKFYGRGGIVPLNPLPDRPPEFTCYGWGNLWTQNMLWAYPGYDAMKFSGDGGGGKYSCLCSSCRFDLDLYGRSFVPKAYQFTVGVLDTNGNVICEIGRYGNPESPAMKPGDTHIGIAECSYLATDSDKWLYINDEGNARIIRVKLGYHAQEIVPLRGASVGSE